MPVLSETWLLLVSEKNNTVLNSRNARGVANGSEVVSRVDG